MAPAKTNVGNLKLIAAARSGSETQVQQALKSERVNKNYKEKTGYGYTPLHIAVHSNEKVAWVLIQEHGVRVNAKTNLGHTPLHLGWSQCVDAMLLSGKTVKWDEPDNIGQTPLLYHARIGSKVSLSALLKLGVERVNMNKRTKDGFTVLHQVVERDSRFPNWYKEEYHSPELRCKVVGLLLDELKTRASEKKKREAKLARTVEKKKESREKTKTSTFPSTVEITDVVQKSEPAQGAEQGTRAIGSSRAEFESEGGHKHRGVSGKPAREHKGSPHQKTDPEIKKTDTGEEDLQSVVVEFVQIQDRIGRTALHYIAEDGCVEILDTLLNWFTVEHVRSKVPVNVRDFHGLAPLHLAVRKGHTQMVERLLAEKQVDANVTVGAPDTDKIKLMEWNERHLELCRPNLSSKAPPEKPTITDRTALDFAAMGGHTKIADLLLNWEQEGKSIDKGSLNSAFTYSVDERHLEVATLLLKRIKEDPKHDVFKKLLGLAMKTNKEPEDELVSKVFGKSERQDGELSKPFERLLILAANKNLPDVIQYIFNWTPEVDVNFQGTWEDKPNSSNLQATPLHFAVWRGHVDIVRELLSHKSLDVNAKVYVEALWKDERNPSNLRATPLHFAVLRGHVDIVIQLLSHKSLDVNAEDSKDRTPLQIAVEGDLSMHADDGSPEGKNKMKQIKKLLMERAEVKDLVERLYRDREVFINAVNALLVGAALIATVTFAGWLTPPLGLTPYVAPEPASPATSPHYTALPHPTSVQVFWVSNSLSFFLAIATVLVCAYAAMPSLQNTYIGEAVKSLRKTLNVASMFFLFSVFFVLGAFASAGFAVLPSPRLNYKLIMILTVAIGGFFCTCCLVVLMWKLLRQSYEYSCGCLSLLCQILSLGKICGYIYSCGYLRSLCQKLCSNQNRASGESHGEEPSSEPPKVTPSPQQGTPTKTSEGPPDDSKVEPSRSEPPTAKSGVGLSEDSSSQGGVGQVVDKDNEQVDKDNEQLEKDDETVNKEIMEMWGKLVKTRRPNNPDPVIAIGSPEKEMTIDKKDIECIIGGTEPATDNVINAYLDHCIPDVVPHDTWIVPQYLASKLFQPTESSDWIKNIDWKANFESEDYNNAQNKKYHVFPFLSAPKDTTGPRPCGHWSLICWDTDGFVHFNSVSGTHTEEIVAPFFRKMENELSKNDEKSTKEEPGWDEVPCSKQEGNFECGYYMLLFLKHYLTNRGKPILPPKLTINDVNNLKKVLRKMIFRAMQKALQK